MVYKDRLEYYIEKAQQSFHYCPTCQPYDSGDIVWILGIQTSMIEYLECLKIPKKYWNDVASSLLCPNCGASLDVSTDVGLKSPYEIEQEKFIEKLYRSWYKNYEIQFNEFFEYLEKYPYLGLANKFGKKIKKFISELTPIKIENQSWYRAREVKSSELLSTNDLYPPDPNDVSISEGRFNHFGQQVFYLSETEDCAIKEVLDKDGIAWIQKFKINKITNIIDLSPDHTNTPSNDISVIAFGLIYIGALYKPVKRTNGWKPEYFISRFIADCLKEKGFNGIVFKSTRHFLNNLVLFNWTKNNIEAVDKPKILTFKKNNSTFYFNTDANEL